MSDSVTALLITPPLTDPTAPYHSLIYLASFARANGFPNIEIEDCNIEALTHAANQRILDDCLDRWEKRRINLMSKGDLDPHEQLEYGGLSLARGLNPSGPQKAIAALQDPTSFYDFASYRTATKTLEFWIKCLSNEGIPAQFSSRFLLNDESLFSVSSVKDLTNDELLDKLMTPLSSYFNDVFFPKLTTQQPDVIGITIAYTSQLPYAIWLLRQIRKLLPKAVLICGGTEVSDVWKYLGDRQRFAELFHCASACVVGEGETAFLRILQSIQTGNSLFGIANVISLEHIERGASPLRLFYEDIDALPSPDYSLMDTTRYYSPHPFLFYSPTRGCYWNQCTFCDYGLNSGSPTSPWRQRRLDLTIKDLKLASTLTKHIYFSVDVLAPSALLKLAQGIVDEGIDICWSAEIRLEKYFNPERCRLLRRSGCVAVSVGFESASQRILDLIKKGTRKDDVAITIRNFTEAGIAVQIMGFTGFPSETFEEAMESIRFLCAHREHWTVGGIGKFQLTPGAIIAQRPHDFKICNIKPYAGADIHRVLNFDESGAFGKNLDEVAEIDLQKRQLACSEFERPFAGGIDTAHSVFYYARHGLKFPSTVQAGAQQAISDDVLVLLNGTLIEDEPFDQLFGPEDLGCMHKVLHQNGAMPGREELLFALNRFGSSVSRIDLRNPIFIRVDGVAIPCSEELWEILRRVNGTRSLRDIIREIEGSLAKEADDVRVTYMQLVAFIKFHRLVKGSDQQGANSVAVGSAQSYENKSIAIGEMKYA